MTAELLVLATPSIDEVNLVNRLQSALMYHNSSNRIVEEYYEGSHIVQEFGISTPPSMRGLQTPVGWPATVVDVLEERLDFLGWTNGEQFGLDVAFNDNMLDVDSGLAHIDALIYGISFIVVGTGYEGEPEVLITMESPKTMTAIWDSRSRRVKAALSVKVDADETTYVLYKPNETVTIEAVNGTMYVVSRDQHNLNRVPVVPLINKTRASAVEGRSEITKPVRYYTENACRVMKGMEINREFYSAPQRVALNVTEDSFKDSDGNLVNQWTSIQGRVWAIPPNTDGEPSPSVQQMVPTSPAPYIDQIRVLGELLAAEAGFPSSYLGFQNANPTSADAIRAGEARLVKRAERRQVGFGRAWMEVARLVLLVRDGVVPDDFNLVSVRWRDAATPTRAAAADEVTKLVGAGILPAESQIVMDRVGLSPNEQVTVIADRRKARSANMLVNLNTAAGAANGNA